MWTQAQLSQCFEWGRDPGLIDGGVQIGLAAKAGGRGGSPNVVEHCLVAVQGVTGPVATNQVEHAMLDQVPFGGPGG